MASVWRQNYDARQAALPERKKPPRKVLGSTFGSKLDWYEAIPAITALGFGLGFGVPALMGGGAAGAAEPLGAAASGQALGSTAGVGQGAALGNTAGLLSGPTAQGVTGMGMGAGGNIAGVTPALAGGSNLGSAASGGGFMKGVGNFFGSNNIGDGQFTFGDVTDTLDIASQVNSMGGGTAPVGQQQEQRGTSLRMTPEDKVESNTSELDAASESAWRAGVDNISKNLGDESTMLGLALMQQMTGREVALPGLLALSTYQTLRDRQ